MSQDHDVSLARSPSFLPSICVNSSKKTNVERKNERTNARELCELIGLSKRDILEAMTDYGEERVLGAAAKVTALQKGGYAEYPEGLFWSTIRSKRRGKRPWTVEEVELWIEEGMPALGRETQVEWLKRRYENGRAR